MSRATAAAQRGSAIDPRCLARNPVKRWREEPVVPAVLSDADKRERLLCVLVVCELDASQTAVVDRHLPLNRLDQEADEGTYLIAWDDRLPVGHARIAWRGTQLGLPEIQDVFVSPEHRRRGIATALAHAAEARAWNRGWEAISLSVSRDKNAVARSMYTGLGYAAADIPPVRVTGVITLRGQPLEVDDTLIYMLKPLER